MGDTMQQFRTHTCADLRKSDIGKPVKLSGWIHNKRDHGGVLFIDLRDNYGITQVVVRPESGILDETARLRKEFVVLFEGMVERLVIGQPEPDRVGAVVVRYHHVCYPKNLLEVLARMRAKRQSTMAEPLRNEDMSSVHVL